MRLDFLALCGEVERMLKNSGFFVKKPSFYEGFFLFLMY